ncbi:MAG: bifunctional glutamate N-acetyltransferase/amino-acid acetyltransferase ArgJ [Candidatus Omnitrophica bacterium]|nr:bifunctional glutamate N-acetyltransferase/amino-acid acetyltransferase ArgJ [Candidatus Omnitrophota bacterium]
MRFFKKAVLPQGFKANGLACGIKRSGKLDLALFVSEVSAKVSCQFTSNKLQAAPIVLSRRYLKESSIFRAVIVNSGNANCFNGEAGLRDAELVAQKTAEALKSHKKSVLVSSTGIIGRRLPVSKITASIPQLVNGLTLSGINKAKKAILTTDNFTKEFSVKFNIKGRPVTICGVSKGAGMIAPCLSRHATMLAFIFTDAAVSQAALNRALSVSVENSFNSITVDGCMSTNDMVVLMANGVSKNKLIDKGKEMILFQKALDKVCLELAKSIVKDAEGATKFIEIRVEKARGRIQAKKAALAVANSNLFKAAMFGENPNFGRIAAAIGSSGIEVKEKDIRIRVSPLDKKYIRVNISLNTGGAEALSYTSDLTPEYVRINAEYS